MNEFFERITKLPPKKLALLALELRTRLDQAEQGRGEPIAIVGLGCRVPGGANDPRAFWQLLKDGVDAVTEIPADRWDVDACYNADPEVPGTMYTREGGFLDNLDLFDPNFFGIAPREVPTLDPQQRLLMEVTWEALEHAGQPIDNLFGSQTGVFVGISSSDYLNLQTKGGNLAELGTYVGTGNATSVAAGRLSYLLGLHGPAVSVDTACSSSLVALHLACQSLATGESRMAISAGVNVILGPEANVVLSRARMLAPDGRCKTFDASADGFGRSEGCGVVILKRLSDAQADGDRVLAVIRATAVNQDGRSSGITAPNGVAQEALIRQALAKAKIDPAQVGYVEAHGTGTTLGDPIEVLALANVLGEGRPKDRPVIVGSVKTNLGHLEAAAGITGLIKVVLSLQEGEIPPHIHFRNPNPHIPWADLPIVVPTSATPWPEIDGRRIAGLSSFGFSGTNAHVIIEGAPEAAPARSTGSATLAIERPRHLLTLSARTDAALDALAARYAAFLDSTAQPLADICYTANAGRAQFPHRLAVAGSDAAGVRATLIAGTDTVRGKVTGVTAPPVAFLFTGQGSQYAGMGRELYETQPAFRAALDRCDALLRPELETPLLSVLYPPDGAPSPIDETRYTQPALFAIEYALAEMWQSWGVMPSLVLGHSVGEYVAACVAGVMTLEDALRLIAARGRLMQALPAGGTMAAVWAAERVVREALAPFAGRVSVAAVNGPSSIVIAGAQADVATLCAAWTAAGIRTQLLTVSHAFHSSLMDPMLDEFERVAASIAYARPRIGIISNVTGQRAGADELSQAAYWRRHVRATVQFASGMQALVAEGASVFLEIGPTATLLGLGQGSVSVENASWLPSMRKDRDCWGTLLSSLGALYVRGVDVQWKAFEAGYARRKVALPTYPFQREHYWLDTAALAAGAATAPAGEAHPLLGRRIPSPIKEIIFEGRIGLESIPFLADHRVFGAAVFPATGALEMAIAAADEAFGAGAASIEQLSIAEPLVLADGERHVVQVVVTPDGAASGTFQFFSRRDKSDVEGWRLHATATFKRGTPGTGETASLAAIQARCAQTQSVADYYEMLRGTGMDYGRAFQGIAQLWRGRGEALAEIRLPESAATAGFHLHPAVADACFQILGAALPAEASADPEAVYLLVDIDRMVRRGSAQPAWSHVRVRSTGSLETLVADFQLFDDSGTLIADVTGLRLKRASREALRAATRADAGDWLYEIAWKPAVRAAATPPAPSSWLLLGSGVVTNAIAARFTGRGDTVLEADARSADDLERAITAALSGSSGAANVLDLRALSMPDAAGAETTHAAIRTACAGLLSLVQALARSSSAQPPRLWIATTGAQAVESLAPSLVQAPLWGFARTVRLEHPELRCVTLDLDPSTADPLAELAAETAAPGADDQIVFRGGRRYVARLQRVSRDRAVADRKQSGPVELTIPTRGILDNLELRPLARRPPAAGEVEIEVAAAGLNFRDVLNALGMYPGDAGALGNECVGRVAAIGDGVRNVSVGEDVIAMGGGTLSSYATTIADYVAPRPSRLSAEQAATIPVTYLTAGYALDHLARMKRGDRVLIHAAAGGVGLAAVQLAQRAGAEIFATAGSDEKRAYLASLGIRHIMSSRTLDFASDVLARTNGEGIDIVLNALAGEFIPESLRTLRAGGRFLEIGKTGIWSPEQMRAARPDVAYYPIYLGEVDTAVVQSLMIDLVAAFERGELEPLPYRVFPLDDAASAFRFMAQARHIGKVVLVPPSIASAASETVLRADASYLITGGLGALGLHIARGMVDAGARHLVLMGRNAPGEPAAAAIRELERSGARVIAIRGDISRRDDVAMAVGAIDGMPALRGIVHSAGVLADATVTEQNAKKFDAVLAPKALGALHLHELTQHLPLDFFVLFSSTAAVLGSPGQVNYASANALLDALAQRRAAEGLPALSINWGPWADGGMASSLKAQDRTRVSRHGLLSLTPEQGISAFLRVLAGTAPQVTVLPADWKRVGEAAEGDVPPLLADLVRKPSQGRAAAAPAASGAFIAELERMPAGRRRGAVLAHVRDQVVQVLGIGASSTLDVQQGLRDLGMDSLMAVELRNRLQRSIGRALPSTLAFDCPTVEALTSYLVKDVLNLTQSATADAPRQEQRAAAPGAAAMDEPIAIVGMGLRLPGDADTPEKYWDLLRGGVDAISEVPADRWDIDAYYDADPAQPGKMYTRHGGFMREVDRFDPAFFGISPREAVSLDPQQRLLLEVSWEALERAGQAPEKLVGTRSGVFVGISTNDYGQLFAKMDDPSRLDAYVGTGNSLSVAAGRLSYVLGLQGPSMAVDTACSSSLVAIHLACNSLRNRECELALAGGVNLILTPELTINFCRARMLATDGRCKTFDAAADGYVRGEGAGMIVLKRLSDALASGDRILAVIRGSAVNQDGRSSGLTVPNGPAQQALLREALAAARVSAADVGYIEAHGTGTSLGDPIELQAVAEVFGSGRSTGNPLVVGSAKTNFGHLEAAAGIAGLAKVVLALQHGEIPPHLHFREMNPNIDTGGAPIVIPTSLTPWPTAGSTPRLAGVSSFGFGGTNAHIVLEAAPEPPAADASIERPLHIAVISARSEAALAANGARITTLLEDEPAIAVADVAFTLNAGRSHFGHRAAVIGRSAADLASGFGAIADGTASAAAIKGFVDGDDRPAIAFLFTGQGSQYPGMGRALYDSQPVFRAELDRCDALLSAELGRSILSVIYPSVEDGALTETRYTQPALFALEYALAQLWRSWGVEPAAVMGHSLGEYVAACVAGAIGLEDALRLAAARGRLMQALSVPGAMAAVFADEGPVRAALASHADVVSIAALNGPGNTVISGAADAVDAIVGQFKREGVRATRLDVSHAFHSPLMEPMLDEFERVLAGVTWHEPRIPVISNVTGKVAGAGELADPAYWRRHARQPVRFGDGITALHEQGCRVFLEVGPSPTLLAMGRRAAGETSGAWLPSLRKGRDDWEQMLETLAALYVAGAAVDWEAFDRGYARRKLVLPTYAFQRQRYWIDSGVAKPATSAARQTFADVDAAASRQSLEGPLDLALHTYEGKWRSLEQLTTAYIVNAFVTLGAFTTAGDRQDPDTLLARCAIVPSYRKLLGRWLSRLATEGLLRFDGEQFVADTPLRRPAIEALWAEAKDLSDVPFLKEYIQRSGSALAGVITGKASSVETLFPEGRLDIAEGLYERSAPSRYINGLARAAIGAYAQAQRGGKTVNVLELGAGTGGTTSSILPALPSGSCTYWFTDVSDFFLKRAEGKFAAFDFVRYGLLDIEQEPQAQGYPAHFFDVVLAANVLHATSNLRKTIDRARALLAPGGILVLCEDTSYHSFFDITIALMEGWQRFEDDLRGDHPLVAADAWKRALADAGFDRVVAYPEAGSPAAIMGQTVLIARAPLSGEAADSAALEDFTRVVEARRGGAGAAVQSERDAEALRLRLAEALPAEQEEVLVEFVRGHVAGVLRLDPAAIPERRQRLMDLGLDSLMAVELRNRLASGAGGGIVIPATLMFDYPTIEAIARFLRRQILGPDAPAGEVPSAADAAMADAAAKLAELTDEEAEALLIQKLESL